MKDKIQSLLGPQYPWKDLLEYLPETDSTNDRLKALAKSGAPHGTVLIADRQTGGRGRNGRSFLSPEGMGVYLSMLLRPQCTAMELMHLTCAVAVAMCDAVEAAAGFRPGIKWTNDLVFGKQKLGGILTELSLGAGGLADFAVVGIGINCRQRPEDFPEALREIACSLSAAAGREVCPEVLAANMMQALYHMDQTLLTGKDAMMARYRSDCVTIGKDICLLRPGAPVEHGRALDVDDSGALVVTFSDGRVEAVNSGEVSVRGMYHYV